MKYSKFSTQVDAKVLTEIKNYADESGKSISSIVSEALTDYMQRTRIRPAFLSAMGEVLDENADLLRRLAK